MSEGNARRAAALRRWARTPAAERREHMRNATAASARQRHLAGLERDAAQAVEDATLLVSATADERAAATDRAGSTLLGDIARELRRMRAAE